MSIYAKKWLIGNGIWEVHQKRDLVDADTGAPLDGECCPMEKIITLKLNQPASGKVHSFWHEVIHGIEDEYKIEIGHKIIEVLEVAIPRFLKENYFEYQRIVLSQFKEK